MPGEEIAGGATLLKLGAELIERSVPKGVEALKGWIWGKEVLVVGQERAGKTTFRAYLQHGLFHEEHTTAKTSKVHRSKKFKVRIGPTSTMELMVRSATDVPGQVGPTQLGIVAYETRPHGLIIILDASGWPPPPRVKESAATWLKDFLDTLDEHWRANPRRRNRLRSVLILMNKADKVTKDVIEDMEKACADATKDFKIGKGRMLRPITILPCISVKTKSGKELIDTAISQLGESLTT